VHPVSFIVRKIFTIIIFLHGLGRLTPDFLHLAGLNDLTGYAGENFMFLVGPSKQDRPLERGKTKRDKLVLQEWGFCGWVGNPPQENKVLMSKEEQPWISADQMTNTWHEDRFYYKNTLHY